MGYFLIVPEQLANATGNTVSAEGTVTADFQSVENVQGENLGIVARYFPGVETVEAVVSGDLELTYVALREFYSTETVDNSTLDLALDPSSLLYYDPSLE